MGVPQGSILSVTLFILKINSIADIIPSSFEKSLFVDDFSISCSSRNLASMERHLQLCPPMKPSGSERKPPESTCMCNKTARNTRKYKDLPSNWRFGNFHKLQECLLSYINEHNSPRNNSILTCPLLPWSLQ